MKTYEGLVSDGPGATRSEYIVVLAENEREAWNKINQTLVESGRPTWILRGVVEIESVKKLVVRFWGGTSLPMYGNAVEEIHLDINDVHYVVKADDEGEPKLVLA